MNICEHTHFNKYTLCKWGAETHRNSSGCRVTCTHIQTFTHTISNKLVCPLNPIFLETEGSLFDGADNPRVSNEEVDYAVIGAPSVFVGQAVDMAQLSHTSRWAQWTSSFAAWIQMICRAISHMALARSGMWLPWREYQFAGLCKLVFTNLHSYLHSLSPWQSVGHGEDLEKDRHQF